MPKCFIVFGPLLVHLCALCACPVQLYEIMMTKIDSGVKLAHLVVGRVF